MLDKPSIKPNKHLLVVPPAMSMYWQWAPPPLWALFMASREPDTYIWDGTILGDPRDHISGVKPSVVGCTVHTSIRNNALDILRTAKENGCITVAGGAHFNSEDMFRQWKEHYPFVDHIIRGSGEESWHRICRGEELNTDGKFVIEDASNHRGVLPWHLVEPDKYPPRDIGIRRGVDLSKTPRISIVTSRGCVGHCSFCSAGQLGYQSFNKDFVLDNILELSSRYGIKHLCIDDDCWGIDKDLSSSVCALLGRLGFVWQATTRVDVASEELIRMMSDGGCWQLAIGIESTSSKVLGAMRKKVDIEKVPQIREWTRRYGINLSLLMMRGYPGQTILDEMDDNDWVKSVGPDGMGCLGHTLVLPGTELWNKAVKAGYVSEDYWLGDEPYLKANRNWRL